MEAAAHFSSDEEDQSFANDVSQLASLDQSVTALGCSPLKLQKLSTERKKTYLAKSEEERFAQYQRVPGTRDNHQITVLYLYLSPIYT